MNVSIVVHSVHTFISVDLLGEDVLLDDYDEETDDDIDEGRKPLGQHHGELVGVIRGDSGGVKTHGEVAATGGVEVQETDDETRQHQADTPDVFHQEDQEDVVVPGCIVHGPHLDNNIFSDSDTVILVVGADFLVVVEEVHKIVVDNAVIASGGVPLADDTKVGHLYLNDSNRSRRTVHHKRLWITGGDYNITNDVSVLHGFSFYT